MSSPADQLPVHPVLRFAAGVSEDLVGLIDRVGFLSPQETASALVQLHAGEAGMAALKLALIAHAERVGVAGLEACTSMEAWLRTRLLLDPREARRQVRLARQLDAAGHEATRTALATGRVDVVAARIILDTLETLETLPAEVEAGPESGPELGPESGLVARAQSHLLDLAQIHDVRELRVLARHVEAVIDPVGAEQREAEALARAEAKACRESWCHVWFEESTQSAVGRFQVDLVTGRKLHRMLEALMSPGRPDPIPHTDEAGRRVSADERRGQALTELVDRIPVGELPRVGGCDPVVVLTMSLETLTGGLKAAVLDTGEHLSPAAARRLAARHGVIPTVLGTNSEVLDLGRRARLASKKQRLAMSVQQHGRCAVDGCDRPITWADAHHLTPWRNSGRTDLGNMIMPCRRHHQMADHPDYLTELIAPGRIRITRRT